MEILSYIDLERGPEANEFASWFILKAIMTTGILNEPESKTGFDSKNIKIDLKINGREVSLLRLLKAVETMVEHQAKVEADNLLIEKFNDLHDKFYELADDFEGKARAELDTPKQEDW